MEELIAFLLANFILRLFVIGLIFSGLVLAAILGPACFLWRLQECTFTR
jgi:hypothetical protein